MRFLLTLLAPLLFCTSTWATEKELCPTIHDSLASAETTPVDGVSNDWLNKQLLRLQGGEKTALAPLIEALREPVYRYISSLVRQQGISPDLADDFTQETLIAIAGKFGQYKGEGARGWVFQIAKNQVLAYRRRPMNREKQLGDYSDEVTPMGDRGSYLEALPEIQNLRRAITRLEPKYRLVIEKHLGGQTAQQIADENNMPLGTVLTRMKRAREQLAEILLNDKE